MRLLTLLLATTLGQMRADAGASARCTFGARAFAQPQTPDEKVVAAVLGPSGGQLGAWNSYWQRVCDGETPLYVGSAEVRVLGADGGTVDTVLSGPVVAVIDEAARVYDKAANDSVSAHGLMLISARTSALVAIFQSEGEGRLSSVPLFVPRPRGFSFGSSEKKCLDCFPRLQGRPRTLVLNYLAEGGLPTRTDEAFSLGQGFTLRASLARLEPEQVRFEHLLSLWNYTFMEPPGLTGARREAAVAAGLDGGAWAFRSHFRLELGSAPSPAATLFDCSSIVEVEVEQYVDTASVSSFGSRAGRVKHQVCCKSPPCVSGSLGGTHCQYKCFPAPAAP